MKKLAVLAVLVLASFALVACGDSDDSTSGDTTVTTNESQKEGSGKAEGGTAGGASTLDIASPASGLAYDSDSAEAKAGKVTLNYTNPQPIAHDVAVENSGGEIVGKTELVTEGSDSAELDIKAGEYTFYCTVPGHREAGMEGSLKVK